MDWTGSYMDTPGDGQEEAWTEYAAHNERLGRCGPLSACARNGHADRLPGESLEDHVWLPADQGPLMGNRAGKPSSVRERIDRPDS